MKLSFAQVRYKMGSQITADPAYCETSIPFKHSKASLRHPTKIGSFKHSELYKNQNEIFHKFNNSGLHNTNSLMTKPNTQITYPHSNIMKQKHQQTQCNAKEET